MAKIQKDRSKLDLVDKLNKTFKKLYEVLAYNNYDFQTFTKEIYPKELTLNKLYISYDLTPFLDVDFKFKRGVNALKFMIKRTIFSFPIVYIAFLIRDAQIF